MILPKSEDCEENRITCLVGHTRELLGDGV